MSANPTAVNSFNGMSDPQVAEKHFEDLWTKGAFNPDGKPDATQGQAPERTDSPPAQDPADASSREVIPPAELSAQPEPEGPEYTDLTDYLTKTGVEADSFYKMPVTVKVDGESKAVPLSDVIKSFQLEGHFTKKSQALADEQRKFDSERSQAIEVWRQNIAQAAALGNVARNQLLGEFQNIDWNKLRMEDPVKWAVMNQDFNQRAAVIDQHLSQAAQAEQQRQQLAQQELMKNLPQEREKMLEIRPEWRDEQQFQAARTEMSSYARKLGFTDAEIQSVFDHRFMAVLHDASRYAQLQAQAPSAVKRVRTAPHVAQPGARQTRDPQQVARQQAKERFEKNRRDPQAQADYFGTLA
jgi:hypothetical protein